MQEYFSLSDLPGNESVKDYLKRMVEKRTIANSLLFAGPENAKKMEFAQAFALMIICADDPHGNHKKKLKAGIHPDLHILRPEGKLGLHSMDSLRAMNAEVTLPPNEAKKKVFILEDAHRMWPYSANALLKTFEEPPKDTVIILTSHAPQQLLPTIISRCRTIYFHGSKEATHRESILMDILKPSQFGSYKAFQQAVKAIAESLEKYRKEMEEAAREEFTSQISGEMTAYLKQVCEKQSEGAASMAFQAKADILLEDILAWYRDLHLLKENGNTDLLFYSKNKAELEQALQTSIPSLEHVSNAISDSKLAMERSLPIAHTLENLFLKLNRI